MKKTITLCVSALLMIGGLNANPTVKSKGLMFSNNTQAAPAAIMQSTFAPKKKKGGHWQEGDMLFAAGYGFPNMGKTLLKAVEGEDIVNFKATGFGPLHFRFEYALSESFGIGFSSNFNKFGYSYDENDVFAGYDANNNEIYKTYNYKYDWTAINFLVRFNKHWAAGSKADIYSGFGLGYSYRKIAFSSDDPNAVEDSIKNAIPIGFEWTVGCRFFITDNFFAYVEAGYAKDIIQGGVGYKIGN
jgi:opacity protein-like surface antigen